METFGEMSLSFPSYVLLDADLPVSFSLRLAQKLGHEGSCRLVNTVTWLSERIPLDPLCYFYLICFLKLPPLLLLHQQHSGLCCISNVAEEYFCPPLLPHLVGASKTCPKLSGPCH